MARRTPVRRCLDVGEPLVIAKAKNHFRNLRQPRSAVYTCRGVLSNARCQSAVALPARHTLASATPTPPAGRATSEWCEPSCLLCCLSAVAFSVLEDLERRPQLAQGLVELGAVLPKVHAQVTDVTLHNRKCSANVLAQPTERLYECARFGRV